MIHVYLFYYTFRMIQKAVILFVIANICGYVVSQEVLQSNVSNALPDIQQDIIYVFENISTSTPEPAPAKQDLFLNADNETFIPVRKKLILIYLYVNLWI